MIEAGAQLTETLDKNGLPLVAAFWLFTTDLNEWRLLFASPEMSSLGPRSVYVKIDKARAALGELADKVPLSVIGLMDQSNQLVQLLASTLRVEGLSRKRVSRNAINGHFIEDALIYRVTKPSLTV